MMAKKGEKAKLSPPCGRHEGRARRLVRDGAGPKGEEAGTALDRVRKERDELQQRLSRLCSFMDDRFEGCPFLKLSPANRILLERQKTVMQEYRDILDVRVELMESVRLDGADLTSIAVCASEASGEWNVTGVAVKPVADGKTFGQLLETVKDFLDKHIDIVVGDRQKAGAK